MDIDKLIQLLNLSSNTRTLIHNMKRQNPGLGKKTHFGPYSMPTEEVELRKVTELVQKEVA